jgi:hypothetical protein
VPQVWLILGDLRILTFPRAGWPIRWRLPTFFPRFVKTTTTEAAPVFAVFEGRGFRVRRCVTGPALVNDPVAAEMQGRELPLDDSSVAQSVGSRARREANRLSGRQPKSPLVENRDEWGSLS